MTSEMHFLFIECSVCSIPAGVFDAMMMGMVLHLFHAESPVCEHRRRMCHREAVQEYTTQRNGRLGHSFSIS